MSTFTTDIMLNGGDIVSLRFVTLHGDDGEEFWGMHINGGEHVYAVIEVDTSDPSVYEMDGVVFDGGDMGAIYAYLNLADAL